LIYNVLTVVVEEQRWL